MDAEMPAAVIHTHGAPPEHHSWPVPHRGPGQALVRVTAVPVSPLDLLCASGTSYFGAPALPYVPGTQGVGTVVEGDLLAPSLRVWFSGSAGMKPGDGSMAQFCAIEEAAALGLPSDVPDDLVAALGLSAIAAWMAITWRGQLQPGEQVLVLGASGAVGQVAVQAARLLGAGRVIAAACDGPLDLVIDSIWGLPAEAAVRCLGFNGRLVNIGDAAGASARFASSTVRSKMETILGYTNNALTQEQKAHALSEILSNAATGRCTVEHETVPLEQAAVAWQRQANGATGGRKQILIP